jgi:single-strand DNA-binding protein
VEKYVHQGTKIVLTGRIQTGSYTNKDNIKVYTTEVIAEDIEFAESKAAAEGSGGARGHQKPEQTENDGFMNIPEGIDEELPFN